MPEMASGEVDVFAGVEHADSAVVMMLIASLTTALVTNSGRSAWFVGVRC
jgi:hypothetical protein